MALESDKSGLSTPSCLDLDMFVNLSGSLIHKIGINLLHRVVMKVEREAESKGSNHAGDCQDRIARTFSCHWHMTFPGWGAASSQPLP